MLIRHPDELTSTRLTEILKRAQMIKRGQVLSVETVEHTEKMGYISHIARLRIVYSADVTGKLPERLFLKMSKAELHPEILAAGEREVKFYIAMGDRTEDFPIPDCHDAYYDPDSHLAHVLMDDLSETHFQKPLPIPPSEAYCMMIVESLARLHAHWWEDKRLGIEMGTLLDAREMDRRRKRLENTLPEYMDFLGDALLPFQRRIYEQIFSSPFLSRYEERLRGKREITLVHGDAHTDNFMLPYDLQNGQVMMIDWHLWDIGIGTNDLAFLMALQWGRERRALLERPLVEHYHKTLVAIGVEGYRWEECWRDYRLMVILMPLIPIGQYRRGQPAGMIWSGLQNSTLAFEDLNCSELV